MPAYDRPIVIHSEPQRSNTGIAAMIKFNCGPNEMERVQVYLAQLVARGVITYFHAEAFDGSVTSPTLYFP